MATEKLNEQHASTDNYEDGHSWELFLQFILDKETLPTLIDKKTVDEHD